MIGLLADADGVCEPSRDELRSQTMEAAGRHPVARAAMLQDANSVRAHIPSRLRVFAIQDASILRDCYFSLSRIRWRVRAGAWIIGERITERVSLSELAPAERAVLRTVGREVGGIRRKLTFLASTSSFR